MNTRVSDIHWPTFYAVGNLVFQERCRQHDKWGEQNYPDGTGYIGFASCATEAKRRTDEAASNGTLTYANVLEEEFWEAMAETDKEKLKDELIQVAAVAAAWVEKLIREG